MGYIAPPFKKGAPPKKVTPAHETAVKPILGNISTGVKLYRLIILRGAYLDMAFFRTIPRLGMA